MTKVCRPCTNAYMVAWRAKNPDKVRAANQQWYASHTEEARARGRKFYAENTEQVKQYWKVRYAAVKAIVLVRSRQWAVQNPDKRRAIAAKWKQRNPEAVRVATQTRRVRKKNSGTLSKDIIPRLYEAQLGLCACCESWLGSDFHLDHIVPLALGGSNTDDNVQLLSPRCNMQKNAMAPEEFLKLRSREHFIGR